LARGKPSSPRVLPQSPPQARQRLAECDLAIELACAADLVPLRVVAVLLAPARIAAAGLQVAARAGTDPDVGPGRRDRQRADPRQHFGIAHPPAIGIRVREAAPAAPPADAGRAIADMAQPGLGSGLLRGVTRSGRHARDFGGAHVNAAHAAWPGDAVRRLLAEVERFGLVVAAPGGRLLAVAPWRHRLARPQAALVALRARIDGGVGVLVFDAAAGGQQQGGGGDHGKAHAIPQCRRSSDHRQRAGAAQHGDRHRGDQAASASTSATAAAGAGTRA
jgi:hypothetical protein